MVIKLVEKAASMDAASKFKSMRAHSRQIKHYRSHILNKSNTKSIRHDPDRSNCKRFKQCVYTPTSLPISYPIPTARFERTACFCLFLASAISFVQGLHPSSLIGNSNSSKWSGSWAEVLRQAPWRTFWGVSKSDEVSSCLFYFVLTGCLVPQVQHNRRASDTTRPHYTVCGNVIITRNSKTIRSSRTLQSRASGIGAVSLLADCRFAHMTKTERRRHAWYPHGRMISSSDLCPKCNRNDLSAMATSSPTKSCHNDWWPIASLPQRPSLCPGRRAVRMIVSPLTRADQTREQHVRPTRSYLRCTFVRDTTPGLATPFHAMPGLPHFQARRTPVPPLFAQNATYSLCHSCASAHQPNGDGPRRRASWRPCMATLRYCRGPFGGQCAFFGIELWRREAVACSNGI